MRFTAWAYDNLRSETYDHPLCHFFYEFLQCEDCAQNVLVELQKRSTPKNPQGEKVPSQNLALCECSRRWESEVFGRRKEPQRLHKDSESWGSRGSWWNCLSFLKLLIEALNIHQLFIVLWPKETKRWSKLNLIKLSLNRRFLKWGLWVRKL